MKRIPIHLLLVSAGTLDDPLWAIPTPHIWTERASPGSLLPEDALRIKGQPATREILFDAFSRIYPR